MTIADMVATVRHIDSVLEELHTESSELNAAVKVTSDNCNSTPDFLRIQELACDLCTTVQDARTLLFDYKYLFEGVMRTTDIAWPPDPVTPKGPAS